MTLTLLHALLMFCTLGALTLSVGLTLGAAIGFLCHHWQERAR